MAAKTIPTQFPAVVTRRTGIADLDTAFDKLARSIEDLRRTIIEAVNDHAGLIDQHDSTLVDHSGKLGKIEFDPDEDPLLRILIALGTDGFVVANALGNDRVKLRISAGDVGRLVLIGSTNQEAHVISNTGNPEGVVAAPVGSIFLRSDGGAGTTLYVKEGGGTGSTGWVAK